MSLEALGVKGSGASNLGTLRLRIGDYKRRLAA